MKHFIEDHQEELVAGEDTIEALAVLTGNKSFYTYQKS